MALTTEELKAALPDKVKKSVTQEVLDKINQTLSDPEMYETYRDNLLSFGKIMAEGRFKIFNYIDAVKYVSHKLGGRTNIDAYSLTFPEKIQRFALQSVQSKDIASYVSAYSKSKLVMLIYEQSMTPFWVLNQDLRQKALNTQADLMVTANSEKVRSDAANSVLTHTAQPEKNGIELNVEMKDDGIIAELRKVTLELVAAQRKQITSGMANAHDIAVSPLIIEGEVIDETTDE
jgi:hypothetical protein